MNANQRRQQKLARRAKRKPRVEQEKQRRIREYNAEVRARRDARGDDGSLGILAMAVAIGIVAKRRK